MFTNYSIYLRDHKALSALTIKNYCSDVNYCQEVCGLDTVRDMADFILLAASRNTKARRYYSMKSYIIWARKEGILTDTTDLVDYLDKPKTKQGLPKPIPRGEYKRILLRAKQSQHLTDMEKLLILMLAETSRRVSEILSLTVEDISIDTDEELGTEYYTLFIKGKGDIDDTAFIIPTLSNQEVCHRLKEQLDRLTALGGSLFPGLTYNQFYRNWNKYVSDKYSIHKIRHTVLTSVVNHPKGGIQIAKRMAGHRSPSTTYRYVELYDETFRKALKGVQLT